MQVCSLWLYIQRFFQGLIAEGGADDGLIEVEAEHGEIAKADVVLVARQFLREPEWLFRIAWRLGVEVKWPNQYMRAPFRKGSVI